MVVCARPNSTHSVPRSQTRRHSTLNQRVCRCATRPNPRTSKGHAFWRLQPRAHAWASASQAPDMHRTYRRASACTRRSACAAHGNGASAATAPLRHAVARPIGGNGLSDAVVAGTAGSAWLVGSQRRSSPMLCQFSMHQRRCSAESGHLLTTQRPFGPQSAQASERQKACAQGWMICADATGTLAQGQKPLGYRLIKPCTRACGRAHSR